MTLNKKSKLYILGILWYLASLAMSNGNDVITKYLGTNMHPFQVTFLRFAFASLTLIPFMLMRGKSAFYTSRPLVHIIRGLLLFGGIAIWCYGLNYVDITVATSINFTIPIFILILAIFFLKEQVGAARWIATLIGFCGIILILNPTADEFNPMSLMLLVSALMFAMLDVTNRKYVVKEGILAMLFYTAVLTMLFAAYPASQNWQTPTNQDYLLLLCLGGGANLLLFFLLKAFSMVEASAVAPFRYFEWILAAITGYVFFAEVPTEATVLGTLVIIPSTLFIIRYEIKKSRKDRGSVNEPELAQQNS